MERLLQIVCGVCGMTNFISVKAFFTHLDLHSNLERNKFLCLQNNCLKLFADNKSFRKHINDVHVNRNQPLVPHAPPAVIDELMEVEHFSDHDMSEEDDDGLDPIHNVEPMHNEDNELPNHDDPDHNILIDIDINDVGEMDDYIFRIAVSIYGASNLTIKHAVEIMKMMKDFHKVSSKCILDKISTCETIQEAKEMLSVAELIDFDDYLTEHKFKKRVIEKDIYREPKKFTVNNEAVEVQPGNFRNIRHHGVLLDIEFQIRKFLEIDKMLDAILNYQNELLTMAPGTYCNFVNGTFWKTVIEKYPGKILIPVFFYNDDFKIDNQGGPHADEHALSPFYYIFPTLPPHLHSKLDCIFTALIAKASDVKMFGNDSPLYALVNVFKKLEINGISLFEGTEKEIKVYIVGCKVLGDNLGLHTSCGYRRAFNIMRPCLTCEILIGDMRVTVVENEELIRTVEKYENYFLNGDYFEFGVEKECVLNGIPSFHVSMNKIVDYLHDVSLGVSKFSMQFALRYFIETYPRFNLKVLNERINTFDYGSKERGNKPAPIKDEHLNPRKTLQMNANESTFFLKYFPLLQFDLIPHDDPIYQWVLETIDLAEFLSRSKYTEGDIINLELLVTKNRSTYCFTNNQELKPKDHNLLHYGSSIRANGPAKFFSTIRPEAKHRIIKMYTNNSNNRMNIAYSASKKMAFSFASFLVNQPENLLAKVTNVSIKPNSYIPKVINELITINELQVGNFVEANNVKFNGTLYQSKDFLFDNEYYAVRINGTYASIWHDTILLSCDIYQIEYKVNFRAYKILRKQGTRNAFITEFNTFPTYGHLVFGDIYIIRNSI